MQRISAIDVTITAGQTVKELEFPLPQDFKQCVGYAIPGPLNPASGVHAQRFKVGIYAQSEGKVIQDETDANDLIFTPSVPVSDRYRKTEFTAGGNKIKVTARIPAALGADFTFTLVFLLK